MAKMFTVQDFFKRFPDDETCLAHLMKIRFGEKVACPKCGKTGRFVRLSKLPAYACPTPHCGHHIHPMVDTPFGLTRTPLQKWFYAMYLFAMSRHGVSAKELQRQLGVTYKTAWRMGHEIRKYMAKVDGNDKLGGHVEIDETWIGGREKGVRGRGSKRKAIVLGIVERGGKVMTKLISAVDSRTLIPIIRSNVLPGSTISTDELAGYRPLRKHGYTHGKVNRSAEEYVDGIHHTNSIEGVWSIVKRSIRSTHIHVSRKHLWKYLGEFEYRHNMRKLPDFMFGRLLLSL